jgi:hypothetical protein
MMTFIGPRLRKPLGWAIAGTILAVAWLVNGSHYGWMLAIVVEITMLVRAGVLYVYGAEDSDGGALAGSRADERQQLISQKSWALAGKLAYAAAFFLLAAAIADRAVWWWPLAVILGVAGLGYLFGLSNYATWEDAPADDAGAGHEARSPVS